MFSATDVKCVTCGRSCAARPDGDASIRIEDGAPPSVFDNVWCHLERICGSTRGGLRVVVGATFSSVGDVFVPNDRLVEVLKETPDMAGALELGRRLKGESAEGGDDGDDLRNFLLEHFETDDVRRKAQGSIARALREGGVPFVNRNGAKRHEVWGGTETLGLCDLFHAQLCRANVTGVAIHVGLNDSDFDFAGGSTITAPTAVALEVLADLPDDLGGGFSALKLGLMNADKEVSI